MNIGLNQPNVSTICSPHLTQLNVAQALRKEVTASSTAKKINYSNTPAQESLSSGNRLKHQRVRLAEGTSANSFEILTKKQAKVEIKKLSPLSSDLHPELVCLLPYFRSDNFVSSISSMHLMSSARKGSGRLYNREQEQTYTTYPLPSGMKCPSGSATACPHVPSFTPSCSFDKTSPVSRKG